MEPQDFALTNNHRSTCFQTMSYSLNPFSEGLFCFLNLSAALLENLKCFELNYPLLEQSNVSCNIDDPTNYPAVL